MISTVEKALILKEIELFSRIPGDDLARVAFLAEEVSFEPGEVVFQEGELGDALYLILSGKARIVREKTVLAEVGEKEVFGEMALLDSQPRSATVTAVSELTCLRIAKVDFDTLLSESNSVARGIIQVLVRRLRNTSEELNAARRRGK